MNYINDNIIEGGLDDINTYYTNISKYAGGAIINYRRRLGGKTEYAIRDYMINNSLIQEDYTSGSDEDSSDIESSSDTDEFKFNADITSEYLTTEVHDVQKGGKQKGKRKKLKKKKVKKKKVKKKVTKCLGKTSNRSCITENDLSKCKEIGRLFGIDLNSIDDMADSDMNDSDLGYICKILSKLYNKPTTECIKNAVNTFNLKDVMCDSLRDLHESLVVQYWNIACSYKSKYPDKLQISSDYKDFPSNYTSTLVKFKNLTFSDESLDKKLDDVQGFCPFEPIRRVMQLLDFPIEDLIESESTLLPPDTQQQSVLSESINDVIVPQPELSNADAIKWYSIKIIERWTRLKSSISHQEQKYSGIAENIIKITNFLQENLAECDDNDNE